MIAEPVLVCSHCGGQVRLRCFCYRASRDRYIAECIDLDILAEGNTREEAIGSLQEAMYGYVATVVDGQSIRGLIPRPSPLSHRIRYYLQLAKDGLKRLSDRNHHTSAKACYYEFRQC